MQNQVCRLTPESLKGVNENCKKCLEFGGLKDFSVFGKVSIMALN